MPMIMPIRDLRKTSEISEIAHEKQEPIFITKNGYGDLVVMSTELFEHFLQNNHCGWSPFAEETGWGYEADLPPVGPAQSSYSPNSRVAFMIEGAKRSKYNSKHWFRYLRKGIKDGSVLLTEEEINAIVNSGELTMYQIVTLKQAMTPGTPVFHKVASLNKKSNTPMVDAILRKKKHAR